eukprot:Amastigsp_a12040_12.p2 type:complete len:104 gc:universal Amastigsp_a12040_12:368-57(-)
MGESAARGPEEKERQRRNNHHHHCHCRRGASAGRRRCARRRQESLGRRTVDRGPGRHAPRTHRHAELGQGARRARDQRGRCARRRADFPSSRRMRASTEFSQT